MATHRKRNHGLETYRGRRDFRRTPEPAGGGRGAWKRRNPIFVIQEHDASRLHYDFRLEVDGVLVSWAVPKGPSLDPRKKRLAVHVEDHPLEYADFEGEIPEEEYGGGRVIVWDAGPYRNLREAKEEGGASMARSIRDGKVEVWLEGKKVRGGFVLLHAKPGGKDANWILVKMKDAGADARRKPVHTQPRSVLSGRTREELEPA